MDAKEPKNNKKKPNAKRKRKPRKRRTRTDHRGVSVISTTRRSGTEVWKARWKDPDSGRVHEVSFDELDISTDAGRRDWAIQKAEELFGRRRALSLGAARIPWSFECR